MVKIIQRHNATVIDYQHTRMSGLASMIVQTDDAGIETIYGDYRPISHIAEAFPPGSRCQIFLTDDGFQDWHVADIDEDLSGLEEPAGDSGPEFN